MKNNKRKNEHTLIAKSEFKRSLINKPMVLKRKLKAEGLKRKKKEALINEIEQRENKYENTKRKKNEHTLTRIGGPRERKKEALETK